ncbi:saccharopine dehydrogenase [Geomicrobium sp. JCM 19037]|uniref:hypothetical protein n=1 Tax=Geomicrobium sp. JCM 19037 TaxID=1460634 RepID=UPI00045F222A|nr:hypothetical protein [Geomicrobium sp. JCM 19037]GAK04424.1 saccharopine dehydrogenase [Geomicrobium sp. JCM 19037]
MKNVLIIGATGVLGKLVCNDIKNLIPEDVTLIITDYNKERGVNFATSLGNHTKWRYLDVKEDKSIEQALIGIDMAVVLIKQFESKIQEIALKMRIPSLDVTPSYSLYSRVMKYHDDALKQGTGVLLLSGFLPGLSGLLIKKAIDDFDYIESVDLGFLQNKNADVGIAGVKDMLRLIDEPIISGDQKISSFSQSKKMYFLGHAKYKKVRNIEHSERILLSNMFPVNFWTGWSNRPFNYMIYLLKKTQLLPFIYNLNSGVMKRIVKHNPQKKRRCDAYCRS